MTSGAHAEGSTLVNNSIGVQEAEYGVPDLTPIRENPDLRRLDFTWKVDPQGEPRAWLTPALPGETPRGWYWLGDGEWVSSHVALFLQHIGPRPGAQGVWAFQSLGSALAIVDPTGPPDTWSVRQVRIPFAVPAEAATPDRPETCWGAAVLYVELGMWCVVSPWDQFLYIYGVREARGDKQLRLTRVHPELLERFDHWSFWDGSDGSPDPTRAAPIASGVANELTVDRLQVEGDRRQRHVMVHSEPFFGDRILARTARHPAGPWSAPVPIHRVDDVKRHPSYFTYAAKAHAELSRKGELLISWVINSHDFAAMVGDASIYRPRFASVPLSLLPDPPD